MSEQSWEVCDRTVILNSSGVLYIPDVAVLCEDVKDIYVGATKVYTRTDFNITVSDFVTGLSNTYDIPNVAKICEDMALLHDGQTYMLEPDIGYVRVIGEKVSSVEYHDGAYLIMTVSGCMITLS